MGVIRKAAGFAKKNVKVIGAGAGGLAVGGVAGYALGRMSRGKRHAVGTGKLKSQVMRLTLKIKKKQLQRKLFKEEMRF
jgi:hypothetical protein